MKVFPHDEQLRVMKQMPSSLERVEELQNPVAQMLNSAHPLEAHANGWRANQEAAHFDLLRQTQGIGEPLRRSMERKIVEQGSWVPQAVGGSANVHLDILMNRDAELDWEDVYPNELKLDFHSELRQRMGV